MDERTRNNEHTRQVFGGFTSGSFDSAEDERIRNNGCPCLLLGLYMWWLGWLSSGWKNECSSGFSEQRKSIESEIIQRCHPTFFTFYVLVLTFLCHASVIDAFDPKFPTVNVYLYIKKFEVSKKSKAWIFQRPNHFSTGSEQMHACVLLFMLKNKK